jgi:hypothetical protein
LNLLGSPKCSNGCQLSPRQCHPHHTLNHNCCSTQKPKLSHVQFATVTTLDNRRGIEKEFTPHSFNSIERFTTNENFGFSQLETRNGASAGEIKR